MNINKDKKRGNGLKKILIDNGSIYDTKRYGKIIVKEYLGSDNYKVKFLNSGFETTTSGSCIKIGNIRDVSSTKVFSNGVIGIGFDKNSDYSKTIEYKTWLPMMTRCEYKRDDEYYGQFSVCEEWLNFSNFCKDFKEIKGYYEMINNTHVRYSLDKDYIVPNNTVYSKETCCFIPKDLNSFLQNTTNKGGYKFNGVYRTADTHKFVSSIRINKKTVSLGSTDDPIYAHEKYWDKKSEVLDDIVREKFNFISEEIKTIIKNRLNTKRLESLTELKRAISDGYFSGGKKYDF